MNLTIYDNFDNDIKTVSLEIDKINNALDIMTQLENHYDTINTIPDDDITNSDLVLANEDLKLSINKLNNEELSISIEEDTTPISKPGILEKIKQWIIKIWNWVVKQLSKLRKVGETVFNKVFLIINKMSKQTKDVREELNKIKSKDRDLYFKEVTLKGEDLYFSLEKYHTLLGYFPDSPINKIDDNLDAVISITTSINAIYTNLLNVMHMVMEYANAPYDPTKNSNGIIHTMVLKEISNAYREGLTADRSFSLKKAILQETKDIRVKRAEFILPIWFNDEIVKFAYIANDTVNGDLLDPILVIRFDFISLNKFKTLTNLKSNNYKITLKDIDEMLYNIDKKTNVIERIIEESNKKYNVLSDYYTEVIDMLKFNSVNNNRYKNDPVLVNNFGNMIRILNTLIGKLLSESYTNNVLMSGKMISSDISIVSILYNDIVRELKK